MNNNISDITYFARLLEFTVGMLAILVIALVILLVVYIIKNNQKKRLIRSYERQIEAFQTERNLNKRSVEFSGKTAVGEEFASASMRERCEMEKNILENELALLQQKIAHEQNTRKRMEDEIERLLDQIKKITLLP